MKMSHAHNTRFCYLSGILPSGHRPDPSDFMVIYDLDDNEKDEAVLLSHD